MVPLALQIEQARAMVEALRAERVQAVTLLERLKRENAKETAGRRNRAEGRIADIDGELERHRQILAGLQAQARAEAEAVWDAI